MKDSLEIVRMLSLARYSYKLYSYLGLLQGSAAGCRKTIYTLEAKDETSSLLRGRVIRDLLIHLKSDSDSWRILNDLVDEATRSGAELPKLNEDVKSELLKYYSSRTFRLTCPPPQKFEWEGQSMFWPPPQILATGPPKMGGQW